MELPLRIILRRPLPGVRFALQRGKADSTGNAHLVAPTSESDDSIRFDFSVRVDLSNSKAPRFLGEFTQGPPSARFIYVNSGKRAGQADTRWDRRAKISLVEISPALVRDVAGDPGRILEIEMNATGSDGGPVCATVRMSSGWRLARK